MPPISVKFWRRVGGYKSYMPLWIITLVIAMVYKISCRVYENRPPLIKPLLFCLLTASISVCITWILYPLRFAAGSDASKTTGLYISAVADIGAEISIYLFIFGLLYYSFKDSAYNIMAHKRYLIYIHLKNLAISCVSSVAAHIAYYLAEQTQIGSILVAIHIITIISGEAHVILLFIKNLFELTVMQRRTSIRLDTMQMNDEKQTEIELNRRQLKLIRLITKLSNIFGITTMLVILLIPALIIARYYHSLVIWYIVFGAVWIIVSFLLFLTMTVNDDIYYFCCNKCDHRLTKICVALSIREIRKKQNATDTYNADDEEQQRVIWVPTNDNET